MPSTFHVSQIHEFYPHCFFKLVAVPAFLALLLVRRVKTYQEVMQALVETAHALFLHVSGIMESPISGQKENREFFLYAVKKA